MGTGRASGEGKKKNSARCQNFTNTKQVERFGAMAGPSGLKSRGHGYIAGVKAARWGC